MVTTPSVCGENVFVFLLRELAYLGNRFQSGGQVDGALRVSSTVRVPEMPLALVKWRSETRFIVHSTSGRQWGRPSKYTNMSNHGVENVEYWTPRSIQVVRASTFSLRVTLASALLLRHKLPLLLSLTTLRPFNSIPCETHSNTPVW